MSYAQGQNYFISKPKTDLRKAKHHSNSTSQEKKLYAHQDAQFTRPKQLKMKTQTATPAGELANQHMVSKIQTSNGLQQYRVIRPSHQHKHPSGDASSKGRDPLMQGSYNKSGLSAMNSNVTSGLYPKLEPSGSRSNSSLEKFKASSGIYS